MSRAVVVLRPEPGCGETQAGAQKLGLQVIASPLFEVTPAEWEVPTLSDFDAILAGSANAFRHGGAMLHLLHDLPVHAVGKRTAEAAHAAGFRVEATGEGGLQALVDRGQMPARLLRLSGEARADVMAPSGLTITDLVVYRTIPVPLSANAVHVFRSGAVALLHSGEAARRFSQECDRCGIERTGIPIAALAPRIAEAAGQGWAKVMVAPTIDDSALLAMAKDMCQ
ncbi:MAG: uroporphyrinogen-III synthase [Tsuneonella sp.]